MGMGKKYKGVPDPTARPKRNGPSSKSGRRMSSKIGRRSATPGTRPTPPPRRRLSRKLATGPKTPAAELLEMMNIVGFGRSCSVPDTTTQKKTVFTTGTNTTTTSFDGQQRLDRLGHTRSLRSRRDLRWEFFATDRAADELDHPHPLEDSATGECAASNQHEGGRRPRFSIDAAGYTT